MLIIDGIPVKDKLRTIKTDKDSKYVNAEINVVKLGKAIFNKKESENIFDINRVNKEERYTQDTQNLYLSNLLRASTSNFKEDTSTFRFNTETRIGWITLEFDLEYKNLSNKEQIDYINQYIIAEIGIEPTLITIEEKNIILVGYYFPNAPWCSKEIRFKKCIYFKDTRTAICHMLDTNWNINVENYNQTKAYKNILKQPFLLTGNIFEIGIFQDILDDYKTTSTFKKIINIKQSASGQKSGNIRKNMTSSKRKELVSSANEKKVANSKEKLEKTLLHIITIEDSPNYSISNIVTHSQKLFEKGLSNKTVAKYRNEIKKKLNIF